MSGKHHDENYEPYVSNLSRFVGEADSVQPLGRLTRTTSELTDEQKRDNEEHDRIMREARESDDGDDHPDDELAESIELEEDG
jgi:hypothetical protein